jgi:hypothetical protein
MLKIIKKLLPVVCLLLALFAVAHLALAADLNMGLNYGAGTGLGNEDPRIMAARVIRIALGFLGIIAVGLIIYAGWLWMTAAGQADKIERAKKILIGAVIGLVICLASFAIASFILSRLLGATGVGNGDGTVCDPPCTGQYCCNSVCTDSPCGPPLTPGSNVFGITSTIPRDQQTGAVRNVVVQVFFNKALAETVALDNNFKVEKIAEITPADEETPVGPTEIANGSREFANERTAITFKDTTACGDERNTPNCFPAWSKFRVTINGANGIISVNGQSLSCALGTPCVFVFSTSNLIDTSGPTAGVVPAQMCQDDGSLTSIPDANLVAGWANDDVGVGSLEFCSEKRGGTESCFADSVKVGGLGQTSLNQSYKYNINHTDYQVGDNYIFRVKASDVAGQTGKAEFTAKIRPGHCCNGVKDGNEIDADCGGDCGACAGSACASDMGVPETCDNNLCASQFCTAQNSSQSACEAAGYAVGVQTCCLCQQPPVITSVSPAGGFCSNDNNQACLTDGDCGEGNACDRVTPNGAAGNFITIKGKNFGVVESLFENVLTNVDFEQGQVGKVPTDWSRDWQTHSRVGISEADKKSGRQSVLVHQDPNIDYKGVCSEEVCKDLAGVHGCEWLEGTRQCRFPQIDSGHSDAPAIYQEEEALQSPNTNHVMWAKLVYNVSALGWQAGEKYIVKFNYKGRNTGPINLQLSFSLSFVRQCLSFTEERAYALRYCAALGSGGTYPTCAEQPNHCCFNDPYQKKCYAATILPSIPVGTYDNWEVYSAMFTYTDGMKNLLDSQGRLHNELGLSIGYNSTGAGTDFYIDDFTVAKLPSHGNVVFLGSDDHGVDDQAAIFPSDLNPSCASTWQDDQITLVVPDGAKNGPIIVVAESGLADQTNDDNLPKIPDFVVNAIDRPGICSLNPDHGKIDDLITYQGLKLSGTSPYFGNLSSKIAGAEPTFSEQSGTTRVPNITAGQTTSFVMKDTKVFSNFLNFTKDPEPYAGPVISSFEPQNGAVGQYVTISGRGFGAAKGDSEVYFGDSQTGAKASYDFPSVCADSVWSDKQVIVKVPPDLTVDNGYAITMKIGDWPEINSGRLNPAVFTVNTTLAPSLCKIEPIMGQANSEISLWGEHFGAFNETYSKVRFQFHHDQSGAAIIFWGKDGTADKVKTTVHAQAVSGPVRMIKADPEVAGNGLNFAVGVCQKDGDCGQGSLCCLSGTPYSGQCKTGASAQEVCFPQYKSCVYEWSFSTSGGGLGASCDDKTATAQCEANDDKCDEDLICDPDSCKCVASDLEVGEPCYNGASKGSCDINNEKCSSSGLVCEVANCVCKKPCNSNTQDAVCKPEDNKCAGIAATPICNTDNCLCECKKNRDCKLGERCDPATSICEPGPAIESCSGYGNQCFDADFCPNSPGKCSAYPGGNLVEIGGCDYDCNSFAPCQTGRCSYNDTLNKCTSNGPACDLPKAAKDANNHDIVAQCVSGQWQISTALSCPADWTNVGGGKCTEDGTTCVVCDAGFKCFDQSGTGVCLIDREVCPAGSICEASDKCVKTDTATCECCCRKANDNQDCCAPLKCEDGCGADVSGVNFGRCTGCTMKNGGTIDQSASNQACNCSGASGKYCDTGGADGRGVCLDCAQLPTAESCTTAGVGECCVDAMNNNACRGGAGTQGIGQPTSPPTNYAYCSYYPCDGSTGICGATAVASSTLSVYETQAKCTANCTKAPEFGQNCFSEATTTLNTDVGFCDNNKCGAPDDSFECLNPADVSISFPSACGTCCCNPTAEVDSCRTLNPLNLNLKCQPNQSPCDGANRGLCCGCTNDSDCGNVETIGCGIDTCCQSRPKVEAGSEKPSGDNICRNALIQATFDQAMQISTFSGNVIVAGHYGESQCPADTQYLTTISKPKFFAKVKSWLARLPLINRLLTDEARAEVLAGNYCAIRGTVSGYNTVDNETVKTVLEFKPQKVLEASRKYYVIIRGDSNTSDAVKEGVLSVNGVGMQGVASSFNGATYNGKVWSFTTKTSDTTDSGICQLASVSINPASYLFNTRDGEKKFIATASSTDGQIIAPMAGTYNWQWDWAIDNQAVVKFKDGSALSNNSEQTLVPENVQDDNTLLHAKATITEDTVAGKVGASQEGLSQIYVFLCANPWPAIGADGSWRLWSDEEGNCMAGSGACSNTNFELYYCRDAGGVGTADDLPAILNEAVIRGSSADILKEFYFFRE